jgi:hypothetical protein
MRWLLSGLLLLTLAGAARAIAPGADAPDFGGLAALKGKVVYLEFWRTW